jgi:endonuclease-3
MPNKKERAHIFIKALKQLYPNAACGLKHNNAFQLLVATILSAQSTDKQVNIVTPRLFSKFPDINAFAQASISELEDAIRSIGLYRNKAKNLQKMARTLIENFNGQVPLTMTELLKLPGVGRKTANVVLGEVSGNPEGIVVDTHMKRVAQRLGLTSENNPAKIEKELSGIIPQADWVWFSHATIRFGRAICTARKPKCEICPVNNTCPYFESLKKKK